MEQLAHQKSAIEKHVQYLYGVNGVHGLNVLHVVYPFGVEPEIVLILNLRMGDFHVQGLGMTLRNVNQINHALLMEDGLCGVLGNNVLCHVDLVKEVE